MFDVGFSELLVIGVVALLVIGPEKLPRVARTVGALLGRAQRYVNDVKADINREIELDELKKMHTSVQEAAHSIESSMKEAVSGFEAQAAELNSIASGTSPAVPQSPVSPEALAAADLSLRGAAPLLEASVLAEPGVQASLALEAPSQPAQAKSA